MVDDRALFFFLSHCWTLVSSKLILCQWGLRSCCSRCSSRVFRCVVCSTSFSPRPLSHRLFVHHTGLTMSHIVGVGRYAASCTHYPIGPSSVVFFGLAYFAFLFHATHYSFDLCLHATGWWRAVMYFRSHPTLLWLRCLVPLRLFPT